jgi:hypothetical protein
MSFSVIHHIYVEIILRKKCTEIFNISKCFFHEQVIINYFRIFREPLSIYNSTCFFEQLFEKNVF